MFGPQNGFFQVSDASDFIIFVGKLHKNVLMFTEGLSIYSLLQFGDIYNSLFSKQNGY